MAQSSPDGIILQAAWNLLWTAGTPYYLPNVMKNGLTWNNITIPPLEGSSVDEVGPITLFKDSVLGYVSTTMTDNTINGLPSIFNGGLNYNDDTNTVIFTIGFGQLIFSGDYEVDSGGVTGCAISSANSILNAGRVASAFKSGDDPNIDLAYQYRDKLSQPGNPNGNALVNMFYDQNTTINTVVQAQNAVVNGQTNKTNGLFHNAWLNHTTNGQDTAFYMQNTSDAANNPDNPGTGFHNFNYNMHGFYMEVMLTQEAVALQNLGDPRGTALYNSIYTNAQNQANGAAADPGNSLHNEALSYTGSTINNFMGYVQNGGSQSLQQHELHAARDENNKAYEQAKIAAEAAIKDWIDNNRYEEYADGNSPFASVNDTVQLTGTFTDTFISATTTVTATVANQDNKLVITITDIDALIPALNVVLRPDQSSPLNTRVQNSIANAAFMQHLLASKIQASMDTDKVKTYLSDRMNDAIAKIFG